MRHLNSSVSQHDVVAQFQDAREIETEIKRRFAESVAHLGNLTPKMQARFERIRTVQTQLPNIAQELRTVLEKAFIDAGVDLGSLHIYLVGSTVKKRQSKPLHGSTDLDVVVTTERDLNLETRSSVENGAAMALGSLARLIGRLIDTKALSDVLSIRYIGTDREFRQNTGENSAVNLLPTV